MRALGLEKDFHISNKEKEQAIILLQEQAKKLKWYKKMINTLQNSALVKSNTPSQFIKKPTYQCYPAFTYVLSPQVNIA